MRQYLVEAYQPGQDEAARADLAERARRTAAELARAGAAIRYIRTIFVPEDETCFHIFEADSVEAVRAAGESGGLPITRIVEAIPSRVSPPPTET